MYQVTKTYGHELGLSACFRQWRSASHCSKLHGYALSFKLTFAAEDLDENNWVVDFGALKPVKELLIRQYDHKLIVAADDPELDTIKALFDRGVANVVIRRSVGCEMFARHVFGWVDEWTAESFDGRVWLVSVECREHGANSAIAFREKTA